MKPGRAAAIYQRIGENQAMKIKPMVCGYLESDASALMAKQTGRQHRPRTLGGGVKQN